MELKKENKLDVGKSWFKKKKIEALHFVVRAHKEGHPSNFIFSMPNHDWTIPLVKYFEPTTVKGETKGETKGEMKEEIEEKTPPYRK